MSGTPRPATRWLRRSTVSAASALLLIGCGHGGITRVPEPVYRFDAERVRPARLSASATERDGWLRVDGRLTDSGPDSHVAPYVEVALVAPDGATLAAERARLHHAPSRRASTAQKYFHAWFKPVPPPGTLIRVCTVRSTRALRDGCGE